MESIIPPTMLVLVGEQRIPNAIPVLQFAGAVRRVEMVYSKFTERAAEHLKSWLRVNGVEVVERPEIMPTQQVNDFEAQRRLVKSILSEYGPGEIFVNLTGGTKIMSLAAAEVAREFCPTVYVDTEGDCLWWIHPSPRKELIDVKFKVEDFFRLHGQNWNSPSPPSVEQQAVSQALAANFELLEPLLECLKKKSNGFSFTTRLTAHEENLFMVACERAGIIAGATSSQASSALSVWRMKNREFLKQNAWLEAIAYVACKEAGFDDVQWRVKVEGTETDFDIAATRGPLLLVCSCKSGSFKNSHLDELHAQARLIGGSFCKKAILLMEAVKFSKRANAVAVKQARADLEKRAQVLGIRAFYWSDYADLGTKMKTLMSAAR